MKGFYKTTISLRYNTRRSRRINHRIIQLNRTAFFSERGPVSRSTTLGDSSRCGSQTRAPIPFPGPRVVPTRSTPLKRAASVTFKTSRPSTRCGLRQSALRSAGLRIRRGKKPTTFPAGSETGAPIHQSINPIIHSSNNPAIQFRTARRPSKNRLLVAAEVTRLKLDHASRITHSKSQSLLTSAATFNLAAARCSFPPRRAASWCSRRPRG